MAFAGIDFQMVPPISPICTISVVPVIPTKLFKSNTRSKVSDTQARFQSPFHLVFMLLFAARIPCVRASHCLGHAANSCARTGRTVSSIHPRHSTTTRTVMSTGQANAQTNGQTNGQTKVSKNVLGRPLELCCNSPQTGFYRDGFCNTGPQDLGVHTVCARVTQEFLEYSRSRGNDLMSPAPHYGFPGLKEGDGWCLCASRWKEAALAGKACPIVLAATHEATLQTVPLDLLMEHAIDRDDA